MKPILLKGHTRALTYVKYNKDGDLLFSCSKDNKPTLWMSDTGERVGTYDGQMVPSGVAMLHMIASFY